LGSSWSRVAIAERDVPAVGPGAQADHALAPVEHLERLRLAGGGDVSDQHATLGARRRGHVPAGADCPERDAVEPLVDDHGRLGPEPLADAARRGHLIGQGAAVPVLVQDVGQRSEHRDPAGRRGAQRQDLVLVAEEHELLAGGLAGERLVLGGVDHRLGDRGVGIAVRGVELAQAQADRQDATHGGVDVGLVEQALPQRDGEVLDRERGVPVLVGEAVDARFDRRGVPLRLGLVVLLGAGDVGRGESVADHHEPLRRPRPHQVAEVGAEVARAAVDEVVGGHDAGRRARDDRRLEGLEVVLAQHARPQVGRGGVAVGLVVVGQEVLQGRRGLQVHGVVARQPLRVGGGHGPGEQRVLGPALLVAPPARVAEQVDHRRPEVQPGRCRVLGAPAARLVAHGRPDPPDQLGVPGAGHADRLGEHGRLAEPRDPVQRLGPGAERRQPEPGDGGLALVQQRDLLGEGQPAEQIVEPVLQRQVGITEGQELVQRVRCDSHE